MLMLNTISPRIISFPELIRSYRPTVNKMSYIDKVMSYIYIIIISFLGKLVSYLNTITLYFENIASYSNSFLIYYILSNNTVRF